MAYYDHAGAAHYVKSKEAYERFRESLKNDEKNEESQLTFYYIQRLELESAEMKEKIADFHKFFAMLQRMLPRQSSIHDVLR